MKREKIKLSTKLSDLPPEKSWIAAAAISSSISPIMFADPRNRIVYVNDAFLSIWGYDSKEEVIGEQISRFCGFKDRKRKIQRKLQDKGGWIGEMVAFRKGGGEFPVQASATLLTEESGETVCMMISFIDISDRIAAQKEQHRLLCDLQERIKELNCLYNILSIRHSSDSTLEEMLLSVANAIPPSLQKPEACYARIVFGNLDVCTSNFTVSSCLLKISLSAGDEAGFLEVGYYPDKKSKEKMCLLDEEKDLLKAAAREIERLIKQKRAEDELRSSREKLLHADKLSSIGVLSAGIIHEIGNPNNFIAINAGILSKAWDNVLPVLDSYYRENGNFSVAGLPYTEARVEVKKLLAGISEGSGRIKELSSRLQSFADKSGHRKDEFFRINDSVLKAIEFSRNSIDSVTDCFEISLDPENPLLRGDSSQIQQIIINFLMNSCQALSSRKDKITVLTSALPQEGLVKAVVVDEGKGIDPRDLPFVMDPFFSTKRRNGNTGLGLSVSNDIASRHGGKILLQSKPGFGTTAELILPLVKEN
ncbi:MAG TPA: ATP-binding protein [Chitinispirillaceae bacterium]|jgi:PAS domain S-box-containing protein|nr:ATP-binding protein [Chitinispirillaceae bacterium]